MKRELLQDRLAEKLAQGIRSGQWPVGTLLPKELEICETEGVSRYTARAALKKLELNGMIRRKPHVGTLVIGTGKTGSLNRELSTVSDLDRLATANPRSILSIKEVVLSRELSPRLGFSPGDTLIRFTMVRTDPKAEDRPIAWTSEYVERRFQRLVHEAPKHPELLMIDLIGRIYHRKWVEIRQIVEATLLTEEAAKNLKAPVGSPALRISRRYLDAKGNLILATISYHPADRYAFNLNVKNEG